MNNKQKGYWLAFNLLLAFLIVGLIREIIMYDFSWLWLLSALILWIIVNISTTLDINKEQKEK